MTVFYFDLSLLLALVHSFQLYLEFLGIMSMKREEKKSVGVKKCIMKTVQG